MVKLRDHQGDHFGKVLFKGKRYKDISGHHMYNSWNQGSDKDKTMVRQKQFD